MLVEKAMEEEPTPTAATLEIPKSNQRQQDKTPLPKTVAPKEIGVIVEPIPKEAETEGVGQGKTLNPREEKLYHKFLDTQAKWVEDQARRIVSTASEEAALEEEIRASVLFEVNWTIERAKALKARSERV